MRELETLKYRSVGRSYVLMLLGVAILAPLLLAVIFSAVMGELSFMTIAVFFVVIGIICWIVLLMAIAWGSFSESFVEKTAKKAQNTPYRFTSSFKGRCGKLFIDVENGMIGYVSAYNPFEFQIFSASRLDRIETKASAVTGIRFVFYLDGKKISMMTLLTNTMVNTKSGIGAEAVSKADAYVELLRAAKARAEGRA